MSLAITKTYTDRELLEGIRRRDNVVLSAVYELYRPRIVDFVAKKGGSEHEAKDVLQEAIVAVFINVQKPEFYFTDGFDAYLFGICQKQWLKKFREKSRHVRVSSGALEQLSINAEAHADNEYAERQVFFMEKFKALPGGCRELLQLAVIEEKTPEETAVQLGFGSLSYFYKRKSKCKDALENLMRSDPHFDQY